MRTRSGKYGTDLTMLWIYSLLLTLWTVCNAQAAASASQCDEVKRSYISMGFSPLDVPVSSVALKGDDLQICPAGFSCCTRDMEIQLTAHSRQKYDDRLAEATDQAKRRLVAATTELHAFFTQLIGKAEKEMDEMFTQVYSDQYVQNKDVFAEFFNSLRRYYNGQDLDISLAVNQFFRDVFVRMFNMQHTNYNFTEPYLGCVGDKMDSIKPFGDYPEQLQRNLKQALSAARTYIQGLAIARNVLISTQKVQPTISCTKANMKMNFCPHCRGLPSLKPCANYCLNVMKGCLAYHSELNQPWQRLIDSMDTLSMRLRSTGSYNLESVLKPLKDQVSLVIMRSHQDSQDILHKVLDSNNGCGQPQASPGRSKRSYPSLMDAIPYRSRGSVGLKQYVDNVKVMLREEKHLWSYNYLPGMMCSSISATTGNKCWNGEDEALYMKPLIGNGLEANKENPEVEVDPTRMDPILIEQINQLHEITSMILNVTLGTGNVAWVNLQIPLPNVSSSTVGEGRAVKSDDSLVANVPYFPMGNLYSDYGSGSGFGLPDDEDMTFYSGNGWPNHLPIIPTDGSGSGDKPTEFTHVEVEKPLDVTIDPYVPPVAQPEHRPGTNIVKEVIKEVIILKKTTTTTTTSKAIMPSSSNCLSSTHSVLLSLAFLSVICNWRIL